MHIDFTISIGSIATVLTLIGVWWKVNRTLTIFLIEHAFLMEDYFERHPHAVLPNRRDYMQRIARLKPDK